jgi:hypothetical protein
MMRAALRTAEIDVLIINCIQCDSKGWKVRALGKADNRSMILKKHKHHVTWGSFFNKFGGT